MVVLDDKEHARISSAAIQQYVMGTHMYSYLQELMRYHPTQITVEVGK